MAAASNILGRIGDTSLVELQRIRPPNGVHILLKLESENPTGSMKDRMALAIIKAAEAAGRLKPGSSVVEYTGGSTGVSLALVCVVKGYSLDVVTSNAFAREKLLHMEALGARLHIIKSESGRMTEKLTRDMIAVAGEIAARKNSYWADQMNNRDQLAAYHVMADEILRDTGGRIDAFVQSVGTAASLRGGAEAFRLHDKATQIIAVEPAESAVLSGGPSGAHKIDGIGAGYIVPLWREGIADRIEKVSTEEAKTIVQRLAREEGLFAGTSTGANVAAALRVARDLPIGATVVTMVCDTGMKYLSRG